MNKIDYNKMYRLLLEDLFGGRQERQLADNVSRWLPHCRYPGMLEELLQGKFEELVRCNEEPGRQSLETWESLCGQFGFTEEKCAAGGHTVKIRRPKLRPGWKVTSLVIPLVGLRRPFFKLFARRRAK